jgi:hypothetical protein
MAARNRSAQRGRLRAVFCLLAGALAVAALAAGCAGAGDAGAGGETGKPAAEKQCPKAWAADWARWADRVGMTVYCPTWLPSPITGEIGGQWNTAAESGRFWQLGYVWRDVGFADLVHVVFDGYPPDAWPRKCRDTRRVDGKVTTVPVPCFSGPLGRERVNGLDVRWFRRGRGSHGGHVVALFAHEGNTYAVSMHGLPGTPIERTRANVRRIVANLVPVRPA